MWEIDIVIAYKYRKYLMYIKENITNSPEYNNKGVFAIMKSDNTAILSIAIVEPSNKLLKNIKQWIAECIIFSEKEEYIKSKKILPDSEYRSTILRSLIMVNIDKDVEIISKLINIQERTINLHSFFKFKLNKLTKSWDTMLNKFFKSGDAGDGSKIMDILKSIIECNKGKERLTLRYNGECYIIESIISDIYIKVSDEADIIANFILFSPISIDIYCKDNISCESIVILEYLFGNIINIS